MQHIVLNAFQLIAWFQSGFNNESRISALAISVKVIRWCHPPLFLMPYLPLYLPIVTLRVGLDLLACQPAVCVEK